MWLQINMDRRADVGKNIHCSAGIEDINQFCYEIELLQMLEHIFDRKSRYFINFSRYLTHCKNNLKSIGRFCRQIYTLRLCLLIKYISTWFFQMFTLYWNFTDGEAKYFLLIATFQV